MFVGCWSNNKTCVTILAGLPSWDKVKLPCISFNSTPLHSHSFPFVLLHLASHSTSFSCTSISSYLIQLLFVSQNFQQHLFVPVLRFPSRSALAFSCILVSLQCPLQFHFRGVFDFHYVHFQVTPASLHFPFAFCNFQPLVSHRQHA